MLVPATSPGGPLTHPKRMEKEMGRQTPISIDGNKLSHSPSNRFSSDSLQRYWRGSTSGRAPTTLKSTSTGR